MWHLLSIKYECIFTRKLRRVCVEAFKVIFLLTGTLSNLMLLRDRIISKAAFHLVIMQAVPDTEF